MQTFRYQTTTFHDCEVLPEHLESSMTIQLDLFGGGSVSRCESLHKVVAAFHCLILLSCAFAVGSWDGVYQTLEVGVT